MSGVLIWRYYVELWTVKMRQGQWGEVEIALSNTSKNLSRKLPESGNDWLQQAGETRDLKLTVASLLADCYTASGRFREAKDMLLSALKSVHRQRVNLTQPMWIALKVRLLNVEVELQELAATTVTAIDLCRALQGPEAVLLAQQTTIWTIGEILTCVDRLVRQGLYDKAESVLRHLKMLTSSLISLYESHVSTDPSLDGLIDYINRRWDEVRSTVWATDMTTSPLSSAKSFNEPLQPALASDLPQGLDNAIETISPEQAARDPTFMTPVAESSTKSLIKEGSEAVETKSSIQSRARPWKLPVQVTRRRPQPKKTASLPMGQQNSTMLGKLEKQPEFTAPHSEATATHSKSTPSQWNELESSNAPALEISL
ncbi:MAG: hypothetical protein Q9181_005070 [Wetmoreana brouardii]